MGSIENEVRELIRSKHHSIARFAEVAGVPASTLYSTLRNGLASASASTVLAVSSALGLDPLQMVAGHAVPEKPRNVEVPLYATFAASQPGGKTQPTELFPIPAQLHRRFPRGFLLRISDEAMNLMLPNGCYALVNPCREAVLTQAPYVVRIGETHEAVRQVRKLGAGLELVPASTDPTFHSHIYDFTEPVTPRVQVVGRVVWYTLPYEWSFGSIA